MARVSPSKQNQTGKTTAYWADQIAQYETQNPKSRGVPSKLKEAYKEAFDREPEGTRTPITWKGREAHLESYGTRTQKPGAEKWKLVYHQTRDIKSTTRRASEQSKQITLEQRQDWYKRNLYPNWKIKAAEDFAQDAKDRAELKSRIRKANKSLPEGKKLIYEHLSPLRVEEGRAGGFESARNVVAAPEGPNIEKSDKVASTKVLRQQQVPTTRSGAIRADARRTPIKGTDAERFGAVLKDIRTQNRPSARSLPQIEKIRQANLKKLGYAGMLISPAVVLATGGSPAEAAGAFVDSMPGIGDITADNTGAGTLDEPQRVEAAYAQLEKQRQDIFKFISGIPTRMRGLPVLP